VRAPLIWAGSADPAAKIGAAVAEDPGLVAWGDLLEAMQASTSVAWVSASTILDYASGARSMANTTASSRLKEALASAVDLPRGAQITPRLLGGRLARYANRVIGGHKLVKGLDGHAKMALWRVETVLEGTQVE
jgi:hypothetical protein